MTWIIGHQAAQECGDHLACRLSLLRSHLEPHPLTARPCHEHLGHLAWDPSGDLLHGEATELDEAHRPRVRSVLGGQASSQTSPGEPERQSHAVFALDGDELRCLLPESHRDPPPPTAVLSTPGIETPTQGRQVQGTNELTPLRRHSGSTIPPGLPTLTQRCRKLTVRGLSPTGVGQLELGTPVGVRPLQAHRLSSSPSSSLYNVYLSDSFVMTGERLSEGDLNAIRDAGGQGRREAYHSAYRLRVSLDLGFAQSGPLGGRLARFRNEVRGGRLLYGVKVDVPTLPLLELPGPSPEPLAGSPAIGASKGMVRSQNGELVFSDRHLELPSGRLPLGFSTTYRSQILRDGPLGPGFTFEYEQRFVEVPEGTTGDAHPVVVRSEEAGTRRARGGDLLFHGRDGGHAGVRATLGVDAAR
ncbi:MAG: hypothetical protein HC927_03435, partial [Deltaproteobacteria bacterium]|nr:hypothetical protein [Deltaproteobacteria bacterium]